MRALIVGAGAVGLVYGQALARSGAEVAFFVKEKHAEEARRGFTLYALNRKGAAERLEGCGVLTTPDEAREQPWDQVWLAVSTPALTGPWLDDLLRATSDATVVCLQGPEARARLGPIAGDRLVMGVIAFIAYQAPLPGETRFPAPGIAYWYPPSGSPFDGPPARRDPIVEALVRGGCPAVRSGPLDSGAAYVGGLLLSHVLALDSVGWSWVAVRRGDTLALAARAFREICAIGAHESGTRPPWWRRLVGPPAARLVMRIAPWIVPIDLPTYLGYHFTKVGRQTREGLEHDIAAGRAAGLPVDALLALRARLAPEASFPNERIV